MSNAKTAAQQLAQEILRLKERSRIEKDRHKQKRQRLEEVAAQQSQELVQLREQLRNMEFEQQKQLDEFETKHRQQQMLLEQTRNELAREKDSQQRAPSPSAAGTIEPPTAMRTMVLGLQNRLSDANSQINSLEDELGQTKVELAEARGKAVSAQHMATAAQEQSERQAQGAASQILELQDTIKDLKNTHVTELESHKLEQERLAAQCKSLEKDLLNLMEESDIEKEKMLVDQQAVLESKLAEISELTGQCQKSKAQCADLSAMLQETKEIADRYEQDLDHLRGQANDQRQQIARLESQHQVYQDNLRNLTAQHDASQIESSNLREMNEKLTRESLSLQQQLESTEREHAQAMQQLQLKYTEASAQQEAVASNLSVTTAEAEMTASALEESHRQSLALQQELDSTRRSLSEEQAARKAAELSVKEAKVASAAFASEVERIRHELHEALTAKSSVEAESKAFSSNVQSLQSELDIARAAAANADNTKNLLQEELSSMQATMEREQARNNFQSSDDAHRHEKLCKDFAVAEEKIVKLQNEITEKDAEAESHVQALEQYQERCIELQQKHEEQEMQLRDLNSLQSIHEDLKNRYSLALEEHATALAKVTKSEHLVAQELLEKAVQEEAQKGQRALADARAMWLAENSDLARKLRDEMESTEQGFKKANSSYEHELEAMQAQITSHQQGENILRRKIADAEKRELLAQEKAQAAAQHLSKNESDAESKAMMHLQTIKARDSALSAANEKSANLEAEIAKRREEEDRLRALLTAAQHEASRLVSLAGEANQEIKDKVVLLEEQNFTLRQELESAKLQSIESSMLSKKTTEALTDSILSEEETNWKEKAMALEHQLTSQQLLSESRISELTRAIEAIHTRKNAQQSATIISSEVDQKSDHKTGPTIEGHVDVVKLDDTNPVHVQLKRCRKRLEEAEKKAEKERFYYQDIILALNTRIEENADKDEIIRVKGQLEIEQAKRQRFELGMMEMKQALDSNTMGRPSQGKYKERHL
eukprot:g1315.t1